MARTKNKRRKVRQREMEAAGRMAVEQEGEEEAEEEQEEEDEEAEEAEEQQLLTDYEKQRERRIKENAEKLAALKLPSLSSSFRHPQHGAKQTSPVAAPRRSSRLKKSNGKDVEEDDDYRPSDDGINSETEDSDEEEARPRAKRLQQCSSDFCVEQDANGDDEEDRALQQALALSLGTSVDLVVGTPKSNAKRFDGGNEMKPRRQKKGGKEQLQFTDDEITSFFSIIDEKGKGKFSVTELEHAARAYDFTWNEQEIFDMIDIFDKNKDGQLDLSEFRGVFVLGNMMKTP